MMFATLDDLEGSVEILVFGKALAAYEGALGVDSVVVVRGTRRPQGRRQDVPRRAVGRPFEPTRRRSAPPAKGRRRRPPARWRCDCASTPRPCRRG